MLTPKHMFEFIKDKFGKKAAPNVNLTVRDLEMGFIFDYDLRTWEIIEVYTYDWGDEEFSREYRITDGTEARYMSIEEDDGLFLVIGDKVSAHKVVDDLIERVQKKGHPPNKIEYEGIKFYFDEESAGFFHKSGQPEDQWTEMIAWDYYDEDEKYNLTIEQWDEKSFEASVGKVEEEHRISNILSRTT